MSQPDEFLARRRAIYGNDAGENDTIAALVAIRANTLKTSPDALMELLVSAGFTVRRVPWLDYAFTVPGVPARTLTELPAYAEGLFYIQNLSSMIPAVVLDPQPGERIIDMAAAPGSKTTQIAMLMNNSGSITANDISRTRLYKLEAILKSYGVLNTTLTREPAEAVWKRFPESFDKVLLDAPCSMEGSHRNEWSLKEIKRMAGQQQWMLRSAVSAAKAGGMIVYSTCSMAPEENEAVVDWLLKKERGAVALEKISVPGLESVRGLTSWNGRDFDPSLVHSLRIAPGNSMEAFYVAKIRKLKPTIPTFLREN